MSTCPLIYRLYLLGFSPKWLIILQKKAVRTISLSCYLSHSTPLFKNLKILKIDDQYSIQLYKLYYKNTNNLLPSYFNSFTPYYDNEEHSHNLRSMTLRLPMTRREFFVQSTKYQLLKLVRETYISFYNPDYITNIISAVYMFIILVTSSPISSSIFISFVFYQKVTHYWQLWLLLTIICHYNTRACVYLETLFVTLYDNG